LPVPLKREGWKKKTRFDRSHSAGAGRVITLESTHLDQKKRVRREGGIGTGNTTVDLRGEVGERM